MALIVHKYGGTSMGSTERIHNVALRIAKWHQAGHALVVVPSAMSGETNRLLGLAHALTPQPSPRELDMLGATGEQASSALLSIALQALGIPAVSYAGWQLPIRTNNAFTKASIQSIDSSRVHQDLQAGRVVVVTGFQGADAQGNITTLGRGGSDTSAVALAAALQADECLIYTDVDGVYTTDPRVVEEARRLPRITFEEMIEMASLGSKVLQIRSVELAGRYQVKTRVLSSLTDPKLPLEQERQSGTLITFDEGEITEMPIEPNKQSNMEEALISGIAFHRDEAQIVVAGVPDKPGIAYKILHPIAEANIDVDMIIQNQSMANRTDFTFTVSRSDYKQALSVLQNHVKDQIGAQSIHGDDKVSKVSVVGVGMRAHAGVASKMLGVLADENINIRLISTSEIKISVLIDEKYLELAVRALHKAFELEKELASAST